MMVLAFETSLPLPACSRSVISNGFGSGIHLVTTCSSNSSRWNPVSCAEPLPATCSLPRLAKISLATAGAVGSALLLSCIPVNAAVVSVPWCENGVGPGCEAASEQAPIVKELLERSRVNKEKNEREVVENYWQNGYKSYFSFGYDLDLVRDSDGNYRLERPESMIGKTLRSFGINLPHHGGSE